MSKIKRCKICGEKLGKWDITNGRTSCATCDNARFVGSHLAAAISNGVPDLPDLDYPELPSFGEPQMPKTCFDD